jgi:hypothetical protein
MKVTFSDSFFESLKKIQRTQTWWYKIYETLRYDIPRFFKNLITFRKELWKYYPWDWRYNLDFFTKSLEETCNYIESQGKEVDSSRLKKVQKMKRVIELLKNHSEDNFIDQAEKELGIEVYSKFDFEEDENGLVLLKEDPEEITEKNRQIFQRSREIEDSQWEEIWRIIQGQNYDDYQNNFRKSDDWEEDRKNYDEWFDGSGMKGWWD